MKLFKKKNKDLLKLTGLLAAHGVDVVLDVGANVGQYASSLREGGYKGRIVSFEPLSSIRETLAAAAARDANWLLAPQMAIGDADGEVEINVSEATDMSSILGIADETVTALPRSVYTGRETVPVHRLDTVLPNHVAEGERTFLKVDTQGFEWAVLQGAQASLPRLAGLQLELSLFPLYEGEKTFEEIVAWVKAQGFEPYLVLPGYFSKKLNRQLQVDVVFFKV